MPDYKITEFAKPNCMPCQMTSSQMDKLGLEYTQINLPADPPALERVKALGYFQAPVVLVEDADGNVIDHWAGFKPDKIHEIAELVGATPAQPSTRPATRVEDALVSRATEPSGPTI